ncbi:MAG: hypothetical protein J7493_11665 [Porphyrobacter sp.]|nr:hypothetical protein [Porphyrobacter sp.]
MTLSQIRLISSNSVKTSARGSCLLMSSALCGAVAMLPQPSLAQSLPGIPGAGSITVSAGGSMPVISAPDAVSLDIDLNASRTVINWSSLHVSSGDTMTFHFDASSDIVLNKTTSQIAIDNGATVTGLVGATTGGNIWFYSPQGVIVSPGAVMTAGGFLFSRGSSLNDAAFVSAADPTANLRAATDALIRVTSVSTATSASITAGGEVMLSSSSGNLSAQNVVGTTALVSTTTGSITVSEITATSGTAQVIAGGPGATVTQITGATGAYVTSATNSSVGSGTTTNSGDILITSNGSASLTLGNSARDVTLQAPQVFVSTVDAARDVFVTGTTLAYVTNRIFAGDDIEITSNGDVNASGAYLRSSGTGTDDGHILLYSSGGSVSSGGTLITMGTGATAGDITISGIGSASAGTVRSSRDFILTGSSVSLSSATAARDALVSASGGDATVSIEAIAGDDVELVSAGGNVVAGNATLRSTGLGAVDDAYVLALSTSGGSVAVGTALTQGTAAAAGNVTVSGGTITLTSASSSQDLSLSSSGSLNLTGDYSAARTASLSAIGSITQSSGSLTATTLTAGSQSGITLSQATNNVSSLGGMNAGGNLTYVDADDFALTGYTAGMSVSLQSTNGAITQTAGSLSTGTLSASAVNGISLTSATNNLALVDLLSNTGSGDIALTTTSNLVLNGPVSAIEGLSLNAGGQILQIGDYITARSLNAQATGGVGLSAVNMIDNLGTIQNDGSGNVVINNGTSLTIAGTIGSAGDVAIATTSGNLDATTGGEIIAGQDVVLIGAAGFSGSPAALIGRNVTVTATTGDATVGRITATGGNALVEAQDGAATLRDVSVTGGSTTVTASGTATLGADSLAGITSLNRVDQAAGSISVTSAHSDARVFLASLNNDLALVSANSANGTASIGVASGFKVNSVAGRNVSLSASNGTINAPAITVSGGDYTATARDWAGVALNPGGTIRNLSITDTAGGLVLANALTATGDLGLSSSAELSSIYDLTADGKVSVMATGDVALARASAGDELTISSGGNATLTLATASDRIEVSAGAGTARLASATLTGTGANSLLVSASGGNVVLGAATPNSIAAANAVTSAGMSTTIEALAAAGIASVNLDHAADGLSLVSGRDGALIRVAHGDLTIGEVRSTAGAVQVEGPTGTLTVGLLAAQLNSEVLGTNDTQIGSALVGADLSVRSTTGNLHLGDGTHGQMVSVADGLSLDAGGNITQDAALEATTLNVTAGTGASLLAGNLVQYLGSVNVASGGFTFQGAGSYDLTGPIVATGQAVDLRSEGAIVQTAGTITAQTLTGRTANGATFGGANSIARLGDFTNLGGSLLLNNADALTITGTVLSGGDLTIRSHGGMTFTNTGTVRADGAGDAVVLASDGLFTNERGANAVTASNATGRWLIYTQEAGNPTGSTSGDDLGGLLGRNFYGSAYDFGTGTFSVTPNAGNRFVRAYRPTLTVTPISLTTTYNGTIPQIGSTITGLVNGDLAADAWTGAPIILGAGSNAGTYALAASIGSLASDMNYAFAFGTGSLGIDPRALTINAEDVFKDFGQPDPALLYRITSGDLVSGDVFTGTLSRDAGESPDDYRIGRGTLSLSPNYVVTFTGATFTIRPVPANDPAGSALLKALHRPLDFNLNWDPAPNLSTEIMD